MIHATQASIKYLFRAPFITSFACFNSEEQRQDHFIQVQLQIYDLLLHWDWQISELAVLIEWMLYLSVCI